MLALGEVDQQAAGFASGLYGGFCGGSGMRESTSMLLNKKQTAGWGP